VQRKLTVIVSADVVTYTALMERDEAGTLERLKANRKVIFDPCVAAHGGRVVKLMGDGALVEFASVVSALDCAREIQQATESDSETPDGERIRYRIGITLGEVIVEDDDIYGDGVNMAARLQQLAAPGQTVVSGPIRDQAIGKARVEFDDLGEHIVRNMERPLHVFALRMTEPRTQTTSQEKRRRSICILPFANMSGDPEQEYFSDGITEDVITDLSKVSALWVAARNTSFGRGSTASPRAATRARAKRSSACAAVRPISIPITRGHGLLWLTRRPGCASTTDPAGKTVWRPQSGRSRSTRISPRRTRREAGF
jgi:adenylate cyclase